MRQMLGGCPLATDMDFTSSAVMRMLQTEDPAIDTSLLQSKTIWQCASKGSQELAQKLHVSCDQYNFFAEAHPKLKPMETNTANIFLANSGQGNAPARKRQMQYLL